MAAKDLITVDRAKLNINAITDNTKDGLVQVLITAASDAIEKYCRRHFYSKFYDELYNGTGDRRLLLREYPIQSVQSVRYRPVTVFKVINSLTANVQARVQITSTGMVLTSLASGVLTTVSSLTFASYPTLTALMNAINAIGNGWSAQAMGDDNNYGSWPSADLYWPPSFGDGTTSQGALSAAGQFAELKMHTYELAGFQFDQMRGWLLRAIPYSDPELLHPEDLVFPVGINNFRIQYTAGFTTIPEAVQEACAEWVAQMYFMTTRDPLLMHQVPSGGTAVGWAPPSGKTPEQPPDNVRVLLAPYRRHHVATNQA
jgi:hypothetical protein